MQRGLVVAPLARDLKAEWIGTPNVYKVPGAANASVQAWDVMGVDLIIADPTLEIFTGPTARRDIVAAYPFLKLWLINVPVTTALDPELKPAGRLLPGETVQVLDAQAVQRTRTMAQLVATDRPLPGLWAPVHEWAGHANDLGEDE